MINEARTLLLNQEASTRPALGTKGEEYIPEEYQRRLTSFEALRSKLFSNSTDYLMQNYRLKQYLEILYSCEKISPYLNTLDSRRVEICNLANEPWGRLFTRGASTPADVSLDLIGDPPPGYPRLNWTWYLEYEDSDEISVRLGTDAVHTFTLNFSDGLSDVLTFPGQDNLQFRLRYPGTLPTPASPAWTMTQQILVRPEENIGKLLADIENTPTLYARLFQLPAEQDLLKLWGSSQVFNQTAALLMGLILRTKEA